MSHCCAPVWLNILFDHKALDGLLYVEPVAGLGHAQLVPVVGVQCGQAVSVHTVLQECRLQQNLSYSQCRLHTILNICNCDRIV